MSLDTWVKAHPGYTALATCGVGLLIWLLSRGDSSSTSSGADSELSDYYSAQLQSENLNAQEAAEQDQYTAAQNVASLQAQTENNQLTAELAAAQLQSQATVQTDQIAANVQNNETSAAAGVENNEINTSGAVDTTEINSELAALQTQLNDETQIDTTQQQQVGTAVANMTSLLGTGSGDFSQTLEATILGLEGDTQASQGLSNVSLANEGEETQTSVNPTSITSSLTSLISNLFS